MKHNLSVLRQETHQPHPLQSDQRHQSQVARETGYVITGPSQPTVPFVFNSPHSGRHYTPSFLKQSRLSPLTLRKSEDVLVDQLFQFVPDLGAPLLAATFPRAFVDLNREPFELDPKLINDPLPESANHKSIRVAAGLGTIARVVAHGVEIYQRPLTLKEALRRIEQYYRPYHQQLAKMIGEQSTRFNGAILIDCHSMPSRQNTPDGAPLADIIIGDRYGTTANEDLVAFLSELLQDQGISVAHNSPYAGGYITEHYGAPHKNIHALQIEINRNIYMNEHTLEPHEGFINLSNQLHKTFKTFVSTVSDAFKPALSAAE